MGNFTSKPEENEHKRKHNQNNHADVSLKEGSIPTKSKLQSTDVSLKEGSTSIPTKSKLQADIVVTMNEVPLIIKYNTNDITQTSENITGLILEKIKIELEQNLGQDSIYDSICRICTIVVKENEQDNNLLDFYTVYVVTEGTIDDSGFNYNGTWRSKMLNSENEDESSVKILNYALDICKTSLALTSKTQTFPISFGFEYYRGRNLSVAATGLFHKDSPALKSEFKIETLDYVGIVYLTDKPYTYSTQIKVKDYPSTICMVVKNGQTMMIRDELVHHRTPPYCNISEDRYNPSYVPLNESGIIHSEKSVILTLTNNPETITKRDEKVIRDLNASVNATRKTTRSREQRDLIRYYLYKPIFDESEVLIHRAISRKSELDTYSEIIKQNADMLHFNVTQNGQPIQPQERDTSLVLSKLKPYSVGGKTREKKRISRISRSKKTKKKKQKGGGVYKMSESFIIYGDIIQILCSDSIIKDIF